MKITNNSVTAEVSELTSLAEIIGCSDKLGGIGLLVVHMKKNIEIPQGTEEFFKNAPFITAAAADEMLPEETASLFDMMIPAEGTAEFAEKLFKDKSAKQISEINSCFIAARKGASAEELLTLESKAFYRLMAEKNGGCKNE